MPRRPPLNSISPQRICLIKPSAFGDIVQTLPVLGMLRGRFPRAHIAWVVKAPFAPLLQGHPQLDEVILLPYPRGLRARIGALRQTMRELRAAEFDLAIDLQGLARSGLLTWSTRAARRVGSSLSREFSHLAYTDRVAVGPWHQPALETLLPIANALGCEGPPPPAQVHVPAESTAWADEKLASLPRPLLALCPGAQWETKRWPPESFAGLARLAIREFNAGVVIVGGPNEQHLGDEVCRLIGKDGDLPGGRPAPALNLAGKSNVAQLAGICQAVDIFVSGDSGPMHLAAALNTPTLGIFTCTDPVRSGPRRDLPNQPHRCVATNVECAASYITRCRKMVCMGELSPGRVWPELRQMLESAAATRRKIAG